MKSKIGLLLVFCYAASIAMVWNSERFCTGWGCGYSLVLPVMPWPLLLRGMANPSMAWYVFFIFLNAVVLYAAGLGLSRLLASIKK